MFNRFLLFSITVSLALLTLTFRFGKPWVRVQSLCDDRMDSSTVFIEKRHCIFSGRSTIHREKYIVTCFNKSKHVNLEIGLFRA